MECWFFGAWGKKCGWFQEKVGLALGKQQWVVLDAFSNGKNVSQEAFSLENGSWNIMG